MAHPLERIYPANLKYMYGHVQGLVRTHLWLQIVVALLLALAVGIGIRESDLFTPNQAIIVAEWLALPGTLFLAAIQMIIVPLVVASVIRGIASSNDIEQLRSTGLGLGLYFLVTTIIATILGIALGYWWKPGVGLHLGKVFGEVKDDAASEAAELGIAELPKAVIELFPNNPLNAMVEGQMLQVVLFSIIVGIALISLNPASSKPILELLGSIQELSMRIVGWLMHLVPFAVFGLLSRVVIMTGVDSLLGLGQYAAAVTAGLAALLVLFVGIAVVLGRQNPLHFMRATREALLLAFSTDSSAAVMPLSIKTAEERLNVRPSIAQFVVPIGATVNMGGTAFYQGLATVFMAQAFDMDLSTGTLAVLVLTALGASLGAPATPGVGMIVLSTVLRGAGVPVAGLSLILGLDPILERLRCVLNVAGDLVACTVMERFSKSGVGREREMAARGAIEARQQALGQDVITTAYPSVAP